MFEVNYIVKNNRQALLSLLKSENLCYNDLNSPGVNILVVRSKKNIIGYFGYELFDKNALFRSMIIVPDYRKTGYGTLIWQKARALLINENIEEQCGSYAT